jgi:integrase
VTRGESKGGRPRKDGTPAQPKNPPKLSDEYKAKLTMQGRERELVYRLSLATGLRRGELSRVTTSMFNGNKLLLPKAILKHKPKHVTHVIIPIVPSLAADLTTFVKDTGKQPGDKLVNVPCRSNYIGEHQARLKLAGIPYVTEFGHADIHAFRTTANHYLKKNNVPLDIRQRFMRHAVKDVTSKHYDPDNRRPITMNKRVWLLLDKLDQDVKHKDANPS